MNRNMPSDAFSKIINLVNRRDDRKGIYILPYAAAALSE
jgi:hypothetical protein